MLFGRFESDSEFKLNFYAQHYQKLNFFLIIRYLRIHSEVFVKICFLCVNEFSFISTKHKLKSLLYNTPILYVLLSRKKALISNFSLKHGGSVGCLEGAND